MSKILVVLAVCAASVLAQDYPASPQSTQAPFAARYEVVQTYSVVLRLDRFTGNVAQMDRGVWKEMEIPGLGEVDPSSPRFQLSYVTNVTTALLLDTFTGQAWKMEADFDRANFPLVWRPFAK